MNTRTSIKPILQRAGERRYRHLLRASLLLVFLGGIASCGGDGTTDPPPPPPPPPPVAPVAVGSIPAQVMIVGQSVTVDVSPFFSDPDGGTLTYTAASSDAGVVSVSLTGSSLTATAVSAGTATVTVTATDPDGLTATQSAGVTVEAANQAPEAVGAIPPRTMTAGQTVTVDVSSFFSDPDGDELTYTAESSDAAVVAVSVSGSSLTVTAVAAGTATVSVTAADPDGLTATQSADITVEAANQAPEAVGTIPPQAMTAGDEVTVDVTPFFSDPDGDELTYTAESSDATVVAVSVSGSSLTVTAVSAGTATVTVTAADPGGLTATQSAEVTVEAANRAPEAVETIPARAMTEGDEVVVDVSSFFSDPDGDELTYTAESSDAAVLTASIAGSSLTVTAVSAGTATVTVTAADPDGLTATQGAAVSVGQANQAPEALGAIPAQTMTVGDEVPLDVSSFFSDPEGDELTYTAESSDAAVAAVSIEGSSLTVTAVAVGTATVTVTAADPEGLTAAQSAEVTVEAANQAPEAVGAIPAQAMTEGDEVVVDVSSFFSDPDEDELTYTAESSDAAVVGVSLEGSSLTVTAVAEGSATVTVTAADPDGLTATQSAEVTVEARTGFRDDFDSDASLDDWEIGNADAEVEDGLLRVANTTDDRVGFAEREVDPILTDWTIRVRMGRAADEGTVRVYWFTEDDDFPAYGVSLGPAGEDNFRFLQFDATVAEPKWFFFGSLSGDSDAVRDGPGEFTDLTIGKDGEEIFLAAGDTELWRFTPEDDPSPNSLRRVSSIWLAGAGADGSTMLFDWIDVTGTESSADMSDGAGAARRIDLVRDALEASARNPIRRDSPAGTRRNRNER
ncbi:Ig-like domain-containing protein [Candidatus Palauibacter sp.]|uniref:Ig-like domain-containing protein n=1 Tax=Candidatus Palauibacter sp. TaxID=3101350 RepID=UPI003B521426